MPQHSEAAQIALFNSRLVALSPLPLWVLLVIHAFMLQDT